MKGLFLFIVLQMLLVGCKERNGSSLLESQAAANTMDFGSVSNKLELVRVDSVSVSESSKTSYSRGFRVEIKGSSECARKQPKTVADFVYIDKLGPQLTATVDHRVIDLYQIRSGGPSDFFCRPHEPPTEWVLRLLPFSTSVTRRALVEVNGSVARE